ncbi:hypothetical protein [Candidatus Thiodictyon syntrophicum]|jgi:hypothetical protein|uniref:hypothetical protein n=1 Tax=Candidatus Thiodictyon syntrophicum TaxID=1166950 RepID=UPI001F1D4F17|nr:hypothetical protein [Candidatus Thiodictyon syntrophicum]
MKRPSYPWAFRPRLRARGFSWRGSSLAAQRLKEAVSEIKAVSRQPERPAKVQIAFGQQ